MKFDTAVDNRCLGHRQDNSRHRRRVSLRTWPVRRILSDVSAFGTNWGNCITEDFRLIVVTEGNEDETEINEQERPGGESCSGYSAQDAQAVFG